MTKSKTDDCIEWLQTRGFLSYEERDFNKAIRDKLIAAKMMKEALEFYFSGYYDMGLKAKEALAAWEATE